MKRDIYIHEQVGVPFWFGRDILRDDPDRLISRSEDRPLAPGVDLHAQIGPVHLVRQVRVSYGEFRVPQQSAGLCYRNLSWQAAEGKVFFPVMEGKLELSELSSDRVQLSFLGCYRPPLSVVGAAIDAVALHRVAEASLRTLLAGAAITLEEAWADERRRTTAGSPNPL